MTRVWKYCLRVIQVEALALTTCAEDFVQLVEIATLGMVCCIGRGVPLKEEKSENDVELEEHDGGRGCVEGGILKQETCRALPCSSHLPRADVVVVLVRS